MATITLRASKGSPLTNAEVDANFTNINNEVATKLASADFTGSNILTLIKTVDGDLSGLDADTVDGLNQATTNTASTLVSRDASGNFSAGTITAEGGFATSGSATFSGKAAITSGTISGISDLAVADGGTGASDASTARTNLGLAIGSDVQAYDATLQGIAAGTYAAGKILYTIDTDTFEAATITEKARNLLDDATASAMQGTIGVRVGTDVQPFDSDLSNLSALTTTGLGVRQGSNWVTKTITGSGGLTVANGDGQGSGDIIISAGQSIGTSDDVQFDSLGIGTAASGTTGQIRATNTITAYYSDERLKENIELIPNALEKVMSLRGVTFNANTLAESYGYTDKSKQVGVIAQDVEKVLPETVVPAPFDRMLFEGKEISKSGQDYKTVHYEKLVPLLIEAIKELSEEVKSLKEGK